MKATTPVSPRLRSGRAGFAAALSLILALACGKPPISRVYPQLVPPPETHDFGAVPVLNEHIEPLELRNLGRADLHVTGVRIKETFVPFTLKEFPELVLTGETREIRVGFKPPAEKDYAATVELETDDPDFPLVEVALTGKGSTRAVMEVDPVELKFGRVGECSSAVKNFTIKSKGTADLIIEEIAFTEGTSAAFTFVGSTKTPATVKAVAANGLPGQIQLTVRYTVPAGAAPSTGGIRIRGTDPDKPEVIIPLSGEPNRAPLPVIKPLGVGAPGMDITLDASGSSDPDNDTPLTYKWVLDKPIGSNTTIVGPDQPVTKMTLDPSLPGIYRVTLSVTDSTLVKNCAAARAEVVATPAQKLLVEMFWDHTKTDMDLHVLRVKTAQVGKAPDDCFYGNPAPDWGTPGDTSDDPKFLRDALTGYGPEVMGYVNPVNLTYRVVVEFAHDHLDANPASNVTVRIYEFGVVKAELTKQLTKRGEFWGVADIDWSTGAITPIP
jgi:hypothetical protein